MKEQSGHSIYLLKMETNGMVERIRSLLARFPEDEETVRRIVVTVLHQMSVHSAAQKLTRKFRVSKTRKYPCCVRIVREGAKKNGQAKLILFIKGRQVEASQKRTALLARLHKTQGARPINRLVPLTIIDRVMRMIPSAGAKLKSPLLVSSAIAVVIVRV